MSGYYCFICYFRSINDVETVFPDLKSQNTSIYQKSVTLFSDLYRWLW